jgi:PAS domain S-box-containing protein
MEDDPGVARLAQKRLQRAGYHVAIAADGQVGLEMYAAGHFALVVVDQNMPRCEGLDVIRALMAYPTPPPIIMVTGGGSEQIAVEALKLGARDYLVKDPAGNYLDLLPLVIEQALQQQQAALQQQQTAAALLESEETYRAMFERNHAVKLLLDPRTGMIVDANPAASSFYGYSVETLRQMHIGEINRLSKDDIAAALSRAEKGEKMPFQFQHRLASGEIRDVEVHAGPIDIRGNTLIYAIVHDVTDRRRAREALQRTYDELEQRVTERTAELEAARRDIEDNHARLQALSRRLVEVQETERRAIARELHDEVGQLLTGIRLSLEMLDRLPPEKMPNQIARAQNIIADLQDRVREMSLSLRPPMLDDLGLLPTLLWHIERYSAQTGIDVTFTHYGLEQRRFLLDVEIAMYRMVQEALTNIARHAQSATATVTLQVREETLEARIIDQGRGFDVDTVLNKHQSSGLSGIRERARLLGGSAEIRAAPGQGTRISITLPHHHPPSEKSAPDS